MSIKTKTQLQTFQAIGKIIRLALDEMAKAVKPGITTAELNKIGAAVLALHEAKAGPPTIYKFPGEVCISLNDEAVHGIPGSRVVQEGDLVKLDLVAEKDGVFADAAVTVRVGKVSDQADALTACAEQAFWEATKVARAGRRICDIGIAVETEVKRQGFSVIESLCGHGIGLTIHETPCVPNHFDKHFQAVLTEGLVLTIEPIIAAGKGDVFINKDGWTIQTKDGSLSSHFEHTLIITAGKPMILTS